MIERDSWEPSGEHVPEVVTATISDDGRISLTFEMENGDVIHVGDKGGMTADYFAGLLADFGDDLYEYLADVVYESGYE